MGFFTSLRPLRGPFGGSHLLFMSLVAALSGAARVHAEVNYRARGGESAWLIASAQAAPVHMVIARSKLSLAQLRSLPAGASISLPGERLKEVPEPAAVRARQNAKIAGLPADSRGATYLLGLGETLWDVALRFGLPFGRLIEANPFPEEQLWKLAFETPILLPGIAQAGVEQPGTRVPKGELYRLQAGETLWDVASKYQVGLSELMAVNDMDLAAVRALRAGVRVFVPLQRPDGHFGAQLSTPRERTRRLARLLGLGTRPAAAALYHGRVRDLGSASCPQGPCFLGPCAGRSRAATSYAAMARVQAAITWPSTSGARSAPRCARLPQAWWPIRDTPSAAMEICCCSFTRAVSSRCTRTTRRCTWSRVSA